MTWRSRFGGAALAAALLACPAGARAQIQLAPPLSPAAPAAPLAPPSPYPPASPNFSPASPLPPPTPVPGSLPGPPPQEPPPLPLSFPPSGSPAALPGTAPGTPPGTAAPAQAGAPAPPGTEPNPPQAAQPPQPQVAGPAPEPAEPNIWVPAKGVKLMVLNKIDSLSRTLAIPAGKAATVGTITITARSCETRPPDQVPDAAAWLDITDSDPKAPTFHGWMLAREPAVSVLPSPVYDVRVTGCT